jgi:hexokinase
VNTRRITTTTATTATPPNLTLFSSWTLFPWAASSPPPPPPPQLSSTTILLESLGVSSLPALANVVVLALHPSALWAALHLPARAPHRATELEIFVDHGPVCQNPVSFPTASPTSIPLAMELAAETKRVVAQFDFTDDDANRSVKEFLRQMHEGLERDGTSLSQIPTYVTGVPNGTEKGLYLAVDLGGTNFRVCSVHLTGDGKYNLEYSKKAIPRDLMRARTASELFRFLAEGVADFLEKYHGEEFKHSMGRRWGSRPERILNMGFTFSFPVKQMAIDKGLLMRWTKGFDIPDAVGKDVCALFQAELDALSLPVRVAALVNDSVGTLMARSYTSHGDHRSVLGAIFGTGTNGAYVEKTANIKKPIPGEFDDTTGEMVLNMEWGSFDNQLNVLPKTPYDRAVDEDSVNPGYHLFEKRISGMFLGEILRLALVDMIRDEKISLFRDANASTSSEWQANTCIGPESGVWRQWGVDTAIMSIAAADNTPELSSLRLELEAMLQIYSCSLEDAQALKAVAAAIGRRAARLSAVAVAAIALQSGQLDDAAVEVVDVGVDGSLVEHYPYFRDMIFETLAAVDGIGPERARKIRIGIAKDGSGVGAALIALVASRAAHKMHLSADVKKDLDTLSPASIVTPANVAVGAGVFGAVLAAGIWLARVRRS